MIIKLLCFWILSIVLFLFKTRNVSETGFCLRLQVEPTQLGPIDRASPCLRTPPEDGGSNQSPKHRVLHKKQDDG
jgi:hypothetical protein